MPCALFRVYSTEGGESMTDDQISEAIAQMRVDLQLRVDNQNYDAVSCRGTLYTLGFNQDEADAVLSHLFDGGFTYCLDPKFHKGQEERITSGVCHFGPDQLLSRLPRW